MKKILITGASGFLGKNLKEFLSGKFNLLLPGHRELDLLEEKTVEDYLRTHAPNAVVHCAAVGISRKNNSDAAAFASLKMFENIARCNKLYSKMIFIGSGAEYDKRRSLVRVREEQFGELIPADPYGFYKYSCSKIIARIPNIINLRAFAVFGKYEDYETRFISNTICRSLFNLPVVINQDVKFDYFSVDDLMRVIEYFLEHESKQQFYNVGKGGGVSLTAIVKKIEKLSGKKLEVTIKSLGMNKEYTCDNSRLLADFPEMVFKPFDEALLDLYNWYVQHKDSIDKTKLLFDK